MRYLLLLLFLPLVYGVVGVYVKDFSVECYSYHDNVRSLQPETPSILAAYLRDGGFEVELFENSQDVKKYDGIIVLGCTSMDPIDVERFVSFLEEGGRLVVDARDENPLVSYFGVKRKSYPLEGSTISSFSIEYVSIVNGVLLKSPIKSGPLTGYERIYYVGEPIYLPKQFNSLFLTPTGDDVMGIKGDVIVTGCFYCSDPLLLFNLVDWVEDGVIDFPSFEITRSVIPSVVSVGGTFSDTIRVRTSREVEIRGEYVYNEGGGSLCKFIPISTEFSDPKIVGREIESEVRFIYRAEEPVFCYLPPALIDLIWNNYRRTVIIDPVEVTVSSTIFAAPQSDNWIIPLLIILPLILLLPIIYKHWRKKSLLKRREYLRQLIEFTKKRYMTGKIDKNVYTQLMTSYTKELQDIEGELMSLGVRIAKEELKQRQ